MSSIRSRLMKGALLIGLARGAGAAVGAVSTIVLARLLTPADFGLAAIAMATLSITMAATSMSLAAALIAKESYDIDHVHTVWTLNLGRSLLIALGFFLAAPALSELYKDPRLMPVLIVTGLTGALSGLNNPLIALQSRELAFKLQVTVQFLQRGLGAVAAIVLAVIYRSYWALIWSSLIAAAATCLWSYSVKRYVPRFRLKNLRELFGFSIWLTLGQGLSAINWRFDQLVVGYFLSKSALGIYAVSDNVAATPIREAMQPLTQTLFPGFSKLRDDPAAMKRAFCLAQSTLGLIAFPVAFGLASVADPFVHVVLSQKWSAAVPIIQVLCFSLGIQSLTMPLQGLAMARRQTKVLFWRDLRGFILRLPPMVVGLYLGGLLGLVIARAASNLAGVLFNMRMVRVLIGVPMRVQITNQWRTFLGSLAMVGACLAADRMLLLPLAVPNLGRLGVMIATGAIIYCATVLLLWRLKGSPAGTAEAEILRVLGALRMRFLARRQPV